MTTGEQSELFSADTGTSSTGRPKAEGFRSDPKVGARILEAERHQREMIGRCLDDVLPLGHRARAIWGMIGKMELSALYERIESRHSNAGASAIDPRITLALLVYATSVGEGSSHEIARQCVSDDAYRWLCGGVSVRQRHLSQFRAECGDIFHTLFTNLVAQLLKFGVCSLERVAQDGTRVRVDAGAASFRREESLEELKKVASKHLEDVLKEAADSKFTKNRKKAIERAARDRLERIEKAIEQVVAIKKQGPKKDREGKPVEPRVSSTDPEARVMKMGDGGFRPAANIQFATTADKARIIVGVAVTNSGTDVAQAVPMMEVIENSYGKAPAELLADGGYVSEEVIEKLAEKEIKFYAPIKKAREGHRSNEEPRKKDSKAVAEWRARMQTEEAKVIYRQRAATAEIVHADGKGHRTLARVPLRSIDKAFSCACLFALTHNMLRAISILQ
jgi:transposase